MERRLIREYLPGLQEHRLGLRAVGDDRRRDVLHSDQELAGGRLSRDPVDGLEPDLHPAGALVVGEALGVRRVRRDVQRPVHVSSGPGELDQEGRGSGHVEGDVWRTDDVGRGGGQGGGLDQRRVGGRDLRLLGTDLLNTSGGTVPEDPLASLPTESRPRSLEREALGTAQPALGLEVLLRGGAVGGTGPDVVQEV